MYGVRHSRLAAPVRAGCRWAPAAPTHATIIVPSRPEAGLPEHSAGTLKSALTFMSLWPFRRRRDAHAPLGEGAPDRALVGCPELRDVGEQDGVAAVEERGLQGWSLRPSITSCRATLLPPALARRGPARSPARRPGSSTSPRASAPRSRRRRATSEAGRGERRHRSAG